MFPLLIPSLTILKGSEWVFFTNSSISITKGQDKEHVYVGVETLKLIIKERGLMWSVCTVTSQGS